MREILSRGKRIDNGEWVEGWYVRTKRHHCIITGCIDDGYVVYGHYASDVAMYVVDPDTVGQYTGSTDKNGKKIYEGDVVRTWSGFLDRVIYENGCFMMELQMSHYEWSYQTPEEMEVVGNIYDNQELLKGVR